MLMRDCPVSVKHFHKATYKSECGDSDYLTKPVIFKAEKDHNKSVKKKMQQIWYLPKVYGGMNTK
mgnify:FL=1